MSEGISMEDVSRLVSILERPKWRPKETYGASALNVGDKKMVQVTPVDPVAPREFGPAVPLFLPGSLGGQDAIMTDAKDSDLDSPLDVTSMTRHSGDYTVIRVRRVDYQSVRRIVRSSLGVMYLVTQALVEPLRVGYASRDVIGQKEDGSLWLLTGKRVPPRVARVPALPQEIINLKLARGVALTLEYCWSVHVGERDGLRISLQTDSVGARALLATRDVSPGERRKALLHWVNAHWRKNRRDDGDPAWVKAHLRGEEACSWSGLPCFVKPSASDIRRLAVQPALAL